MDTPPVPKPRSAVWPQSDSLKPVPLPRTKIPINNDKVSASDIFRSIGTVSKQISEDVALKVSSSARTANDKIEKSITDGSKFAKDTLEKTINASRAVRDSVTKSVIDGTRTAGSKLRRSKKVYSVDNAESLRCMSMPVVDVSLFDNIQFHSPLVEHKDLQTESDSIMHSNDSSLSLNISQFDNLSTFSSNSINESVSNISFDIRESDHSEVSQMESGSLTYDTPNFSLQSVISVEKPDIPLRRKKKENPTDIVKQNSLYENWNLSQQSEMDSRPSKSTVFEFDPLNTSNAKPIYEGISNELLLLESFLIGDSYGSIFSTASNEETFGEFTDINYFNPPTPPERSDSLFTDASGSNITSTVLPATQSSTSTWFNISETETPSISIKEIKSTNSIKQKFSHMLKLDTVLHKSVKQNNKKIKIVQQPSISFLPVACYSGTLTRIISGVVEDLFKNSQSRYCILADKKFMCYTDPTNSILKESYDLESIYSLQIVLPLSSSTSSNSYCFELSVHNGNLRGMQRKSKILFSCTSVAERRNWAQKFAEHLTSGFTVKYTAEFTRLGWCYLKEGVSGQWQGAWMLLIRRVLVYYTTEELTLCSVDLRKTRCIATKTVDEETKQMCPADSDNMLLLDCPHATIYLRFAHEKELKGWRFMLKLAAYNNGTHIHHQQLTKEDVPAIVDKCLSFIYAHGSLTEGIYRRAGSNVVLSELLAQFRRDAWSVQLNPTQHSEHDVAGVLKRFFRDLPDSLIPQDKHQALITALRMSDERARHAEYRQILSTLSLVGSKTVRKLFAHLHFLHTMAHVNKMNAENLASVWAPTIMPGTLATDPLHVAWSSREAFVVRDLIANFEGIWEPTETEIRREAAIRRVLMRVLSNNIIPVPPKAAGDLRTWVYVLDKSACFQITLTPNKTSSDICIELCEKAKMESHLLMLEEVICSDSMRRIVHVDEIVLDVVLRWSYWDEDDRKDNYLLLKNNKILRDIEGSRHTTTACGELRFANEAMKSFKLYMFEFKDCTLTYFKDKQGSHKIEEWKIKDILWYSGHETKRNTNSRWSITFILKNNKQKRSKERPWFGCTIAGAVTEDELKWMAVMMLAEHSQILPTPRLIIT